VRGDWNAEKSEEGFLAGTRDDDFVLRYALRRERVETNIFEGAMDVISKYRSRPREAMCS
jgi:hypothetical protein